ncbi:MAG: hypothetical protein HY964_09700 [Ignavibacteriales bacterium]|nr:hypothetical protein [Ignavibacteriales bacterium]
MRILLFNIALLFFSCFAVQVLSQSANNTNDELKSFKDRAFKIDAEVDSILSRAQIKPDAIKKKTINTTDPEIKRIERKINVQENFSTIEFNQAINMMAQKYGGRAIGSENTKEKSVAIHIKLDRYIIETVILKMITKTKSIEEKGGRLSDGKKIRK